MSNPKLTAAQRNLLLHLYNGEGRIVESYDTDRCVFLSADGSQVFAVRYDTVDQLHQMELLSMRYGNESNVYRLSVLAKQLMTLLSN